jgi:hypothetical protein
VADSQLPIYVDSEPSRHSFPHMVVSAAIFSLRVVSSGLHVRRWRFFTSALHVCRVSVAVSRMCCALLRSTMETFYCALFLLVCMLACL